MSVSPETDPDGVDRDETSTDAHENVRESTEGVETTPEGAEGGAGDTATGLIGNGKMTDPRYLATR
jgi:hypothetical protein